MATPILRYATVADLSLYAIAESALEGIDPEKIDAVLEAASRRVDEIIGAQYGLPLVQVSASLAAHTAQIAAYMLLSSTGYNPESPKDDLFRLNYESAHKALERIAKGIGGAGIAGSKTTTDGGQSLGSSAQVISSTPRGFSSRGGPDTGGGFGGGFTGD